MLPREEGRDGAGEQEHRGDRPEALPGEVEVRPPRRVCRRGGAQVDQVTGGVLRQLEVHEVRYGAADSERPVDEEHGDGEGGGGDAEREEDRAPFAPRQDEQEERGQDRSGGRLARGREAEADGRDDEPGDGPSTMPLPGGRHRGDREEHHHWLEHGETIQPELEGGVHPAREEQPEGRGDERGDPSQLGPQPEEEDEAAEQCQHADQHPRGNRPAAEEQLHLTEQILGRGRLLVIESQVAGHVRAAHRDVLRLVGVRVGREDVPQRLVGAPREDDGEQSPPGGRPFEYPGGFQHLAGSLCIA